MPFNARIRVTFVVPEASSRWRPSSWWYELVAFFVRDGAVCGVVRSHFLLNGRAEHFSCAHRVWLVMHVSSRSLVITDVFDTRGVGRRIRVKRRVVSTTRTRLFVPSRLEELSLISPPINTVILLLSIRKNSCVEHLTYGVLFSRRRSSDALPSA